MKKVIYLLFALQFSNINILAQSIWVNPQEACFVMTVKMDSRYHDCEPASSDVEEYVLKILKVAGFSRKINFDLLAAPSIPNASAMVKDGKRLILYNKDFFSNLNPISFGLRRFPSREPFNINRLLSEPPKFEPENREHQIEWFKLGIFAHEIAHHIIGHTLSKGGGTMSERHQFELDADDWAGFVLGKLGATKEEAQAGLKKIYGDGDPGETPHHPSLVSRLQATLKGYNRAKQSASPSKEEVIPVFSKQGYKDRLTKKFYPLVRFPNGQLWMAKNLNRKTRMSFCKHDSEYDCEKQGRYYSRKEALKICPRGWRLASIKDWRELKGIEYNFVGDFTIFDEFMGKGNYDFYREYGTASISESGENSIYWSREVVNGKNAISINKEGTLREVYVNPEKYSLPCRCISGG